MTMVRLLAVMLCATAALGAEDGSFEFVDEWVAGDLPAFGQASIGLTRQAPEWVAWDGAPPEGAVTYGLVPMPEQTEGPRELALAVCAEQPDHLYVAQEPDGRLRADAFRSPADEGLRPPAFGKPSKPFWLVEAGGRTLAVRAGAFGGNLMVAWRGYLSAKLPVDGQERLAVVIDTNADGRFSAGSDALHVDINGDGELAPTVERYTLLRRCEVGETAFTFPEAMTRADAIWRLAPTGPAPVTVVLPDTGASVRKMALGLVRGDGRAEVVESVGAAVDVPAGLYRIGGMALQLSDDQGRTWSYGFRPVELVEIEVVPDAPLDLSVLHGLVLQVLAPERATPGESVSVRAEVRSRLGLATSECLVADRDDYGVRKTPRLRVLSPTGEILEEADMGFG